MKLVFGQKFGIGVVFVQYLVFFLSIRYFYDIASDITASRRRTFVLTLFYIFPLMMWHNVIQTESLTLSLSVFVLWSVFRLHSDFSSGAFMLFAISLAVTVFLRPASLFLLPVLFFWCLFVGLKNRFYKSALCCSIYLLVVAAGVLGYMKAFENEYGLFSMSKVGLFNQLVIIFDRDIINPDMITDEALKEDVETCASRFKVKYGSYAAIEWLEQRYDPKTLKHMVMNQYLLQPSRWLKRTFESVVRTKQYPLFIADWPILASILDLLGVNVNSFYLFMIFYTAFLLLWIFCNRTIPQKTLLLYILAIVNILLVIIGAQNDWKRLMLATYFPIYLLLFGQVCTVLYNTNSMKKISLK